MALLDHDPLNLYEALKSKDVSKWKAVMQEEYNLFRVNDTWELTKLSTDHKSVGYKWVFHTKNDTLDVIVRYKAWLIVMEYFQMTGVDFNETFAPVTKFITIRCILALGVALNWEIHQMDVKMAFLNELLEVELYMDQPEGFVQKGKENFVCELKKTLYRLKQSQGVIPPYQLIFH